MNDLQLRENIRKYYIDILEREPDIAGMEFYFAKIKNKEIPLELIPDIFKSSTEFLIMQEKKGIKTSNHIKTDSLTGDNMTKKIIDGHTIYFNPNDPVLLETFSNDEYEQATSNTIKKLVKPGMNVINIGANIGYFTLLLARQVGPQGKIFSFEPTASTAKFLQKNIDANRYKNVEVHVKAVLNKNGASDFWVGGSSVHNWVSELKTQSYPLYTRVQVETTTIDDFLKNRDIRIDFVMMDAEGSEKYILEGMKKTLQSNPNLEIIAEYNPYTFKLAETTAESFLDLVEKLGFFTYVIDDKDGKVKLTSKKEILTNFQAPNLTNLYLTRKTKTVFDN